ncbi:ferritin family protein [bacterium]|nr:ferritin family protein [bacterium]
MDNFKTMDDILEFAIGEEEAAHNFYKAQAENVNSEGIKQMFLDFAKEELLHKAKLLEVKKGTTTILTPQKVQDLKLSDYMEEAHVTPNMTPQNAMLVAMKKEKAAFRLYMDLAARAEIDEYKILFEALAQEEAKHKLRFELEYDSEFMQEN